MAMNSNNVISQFDKQYEIEILQIDKESYRNVSILF